MENNTPNSLNNNLTWNFKSLFSSDSDPKIQQNLDACLEKAKQFNLNWINRTDYLENPSVLKLALDEYLNYEEEYGSFAGYYYLSLRLDQEQNNTELRSKNSKAEDISKDISNLLQFFPIRISKIELENQEKFLKATELSDYHHFLSRLFEEAKHVLSEEAEKVLTMQRSISYTNWVEMTDKFLNTTEAEILVNGENKTVTFNELFGFISDLNIETRTSAVKALNKILETNLDVAENEMNAVLGYRKNMDALRGYSRPDQSRHLSDDVPSDVVDALVGGVTEHFSIPNRYYEFKAKLMGQEKLAYHERNVPYGKLDKKYSWEESVELVRSVFAKLDPEFLEIFENMLKNGQFDVLPRSGKAGGAYCTSGSAKVPVYVLLNHTNKLNDVLTLSHEMGHAIHHHLFNKNQNALNRDGSMFTAEVSSTFMEDFVLKNILENADEELRLAIMMNKLNDDVSTIFRQVACYNFESDLHSAYKEKGYLSKQEFGEIFTKNMSNYMGDFVGQDEGSQNWWVYWSHIRSYFYVYSYASGLLISKFMQAQFEKDNGYILQVKQFMSAGSSKSPVDLFADLGVDIHNKQFWSESVQSTQKLLEETIALAKKLGKI